MQKEPDALQRRMARTALMLTPEQMERLRVAHVMLFGLGGVGSYAAEALVRAGIGTITIVDADTVQESNLNRQLCALHSTLGQSKAQAEKARLSDIAPDARIEAVEAFHLPSTPVPIPPDVDFVADAVDTVAAKLDIAQTCHLRGVPLIACMGMGNRFDPTQIRIGDVFSTRNDPLCRVMRRELRKRGIDSLRCVYSSEPAHECARTEEEAQSRRQVPGSLPYVPAVAGLYMAYNIVESLCRRDGR
ncbi:MAG: tRNA threonylcarbamoyladenosine dehydratase [Eubacteriales bacterium]|nr:tRNA threonylcarbamoyladenosine dehydratase [Eubacteriales bacterium]